MVIDGKGEVLKEYGEPIGECTSNTAEYQAVIKGLELAAEFTKGWVDMYLDSELVVKQLRREYRILDPRLQALAEEVKRGRTRFGSVRFQHLPRTQNMIRRADQLATKAVKR